jgi:lambda repressor-like predicted transcriptional regulator
MTMRQKALRRIARRSEVARATLDTAIRDARTEGLSLRQIGVAVGMSPEWIRQICEAPEPSNEG